MTASGKIVCGVVLAGLAVGLALWLRGRTDDAAETEPVRREVTVPSRPPPKPIPRTSDADLRAGEL